MPKSEEFEDGPGINSSFGNVKPSSLMRSGAGDDEGPWGAFGHDARRVARVRQGRLDGVS